MIYIIQRYLLNNYSHTTLKQHFNDLITILVFTEYITYIQSSKRNFTKTWLVYHLAIFLSYHPRIVKKVVAISILPTDAIELHYVYNQP